MFNFTTFCLTGFLALSPICAFSAPSTNHERFSKAIQQIKQNYVDPQTDNQLFKHALNGMVSELDPHSLYFDKKELKAFKQSSTGDYVGVGIKVTQKHRMIKVVSPIDGTPAAKADIKPGDYIVAVNKNPILDQSLSKVVQTIRGKQGTQVTLTVISGQNAQPRQVTLKRQKIDHASVKSKMIGQHFGKIRISQFQEDTPKLTRQAIKKLQNHQKHALKGVIFDLRNDPGGLLKSAVKTTDLVLDSKKLGDNDKILYTKGRTPDANKTYRAHAGDILHGLPIVVLINRGSASGAELMAGALQDHHRAIIIGRRSFGKGSVQSLIPLDHDTAIKITTALFYTPNGHELQAQGIKPNIVTPSLRVKKPKQNRFNYLNISEKALKNYLANTKQPSNSEQPSTKKFSDQSSSSKTSNKQPNTLQTQAQKLTQMAKKDYTLFQAVQTLKTLTWQNHLSNNEQS